MSARLKILVLPALVVTAIGGQSAEAAQPSLKVVSPATPSVALTANPGGSGSVGTLVLTVSNRSQYSGPIEIGFIDSRGRTVRPVPGNVAITPRPLLLVSKRESIDSFGLATVKIRFLTSVPPTAALSGLLTVSPAAGSEVQPATAELTLSSPETPRLSKASLAPDTLTVKATRLLPSAFSGGGVVTPGQDDEVKLTGIAAGKPIDEGQVLTTARLSASSGGQIDVNLVAADEIPGTATSGKARVELEGVEKWGSYEGDLALDPGNDESPKLSVKVEAKDLPLWPLGAVLVGALFSFLFLKLWDDRERPRRVLAEELTAAAESYWKARDGKVNDDGSYNLDELFGRAGANGGKLPDGSGAAALLTEIRSAKTQEALEKKRVEVAGHAAAAALWPKVQEQTTALRKALEGLPQQDMGLPIAAATRKLLDRRTADDPAAYLKELTDQTTAVAGWIAAQEIFKVAQALHEELLAADPPPHEPYLALIRWADPKAIYDAYLAPVQSLADLRERRALDRLLESLRTLDGLTDDPTRLAPGGIQFRLQREAWEGRVEGLPEPGKEPADARAGALPDLTPAKTEATPLSAKLRAQIVERDTLNFWVSAGLVALAWVAALYAASATYGSLWQYLGAFLAGATGTLAINWALLPWYRSYVSKPAKAA